MISDRKILSIIAVLKILALATLIIAIGGTFWSMGSAKIFYFVGEGKYLRAIIYFIIFAVAVSGLIITPFLRSFWLRIGLVTVFFLAYVIDELSKDIVGAPLSPDMAGVLIANMGMASEILPSYNKAILQAALPALILAIIFILPARAPLVLLNRFALVPAGALFVIVFATIASFATVIQFPVFYSVPAKITEAALFRFYSGERRKVTYSGSLNPAIRHVVLLVDESVRGDYLGINNPDINTTPRLHANRDRLINFGTTVASWNCSIFSRVILRTGLREDQLPDVAQEGLKQPSIWQYAHKAGYQTVFVDGFMKPGRYHSFMNDREFAQIDRAHYFADIDPIVRDRKMIDVLARYLTSDKPSFILLNKRGIHFPFYAQYPKQAAELDTGPGGSPGVGAKTGHVINSYHNAIKWNVDGFFEKFFRVVNVRDSVIIYTGDHGVSFFDKGRKTPHCNMGDTQIGEGLVPLFVISGNRPLRKKFEENRKRAFNRLTHFQIFPTLLRLFGYEKAWVAKHYGGDIFSAPPQVRRFRNGSIFLDVRDALRPDRQGRWIEVDRLNVGH